MKLIFYPACYWLALGVLSSAVFVSGCGPEQQRRPAEASTIISNYQAFRMAVTNNDFTQAFSFLNQKFARIFNTNEFFGGSTVFLDAKSELTTNAYVEFDSAAHAWLWPQSRPILGAYGIGFVKESNAWKLDANFTGVQD